MIRQGTYGLPGQPHATATTGRLGRVDGPVEDGTPDANHASIQVHVLPFEPKKLPLSEAGGYGQDVEGL
jgi:hypothetical protein